MKLTKETKTEKQIVETEVEVDEVVLRLTKKEALMLFLVMGGIGNRNEIRDFTDKIFYKIEQIYGEESNILDYRDAVKTTMQLSPVWKFPDNILE